MKYANILEGEIKNKVAHDYFSGYDSTKLIGNIDFCITLKNKNEQQGRIDIESLFWAEAKSNKSDINESIVQLILTIGKAYSKIFSNHLPPSFLGAFDSDRIAFIPYNEIYDVFTITDFNWNVTPSNHNTKEFKLLHKKVKTILEKNSLEFTFGSDDKQIKEFVKANFILGKSETSKIRIDKNNFTIIFDKWLKAVQPTIAMDWKLAKQGGIISGDFYLADLLSRENSTLKDNLYVVLQATKYEMNKHKNIYGAFTSSTVEFSDNQKAHTKFWNKYERPPKEEYWAYIIERRDLLVPQDVREWKGSFFTPQIWVERSQKYLADTLGENWQEEYYVWDCAAGTGNLLTGLTYQHHIWASTLDEQDVKVMHDRIDTMNKNSPNGDGSNLLHNHVFQFDFLNDEFTKLPKSLQDVINNPEKRKKLVIYINPPYAEVSSKDVKGKVGVNQTKIHTKYTTILGTAGRELFAQFFIRIISEINGCILAEFSTMKALQGSAFEGFRNHFQAKLMKCFVVPADTFDNVKGKFPIGFKIWDTGKKKKFDKIRTDVYNQDGERMGSKIFCSYNKDNYINKWISKYKMTSENAIGFMDGINGNDFQHNNIVYILNSKEQLPNPRGIWINKNNLIPVAIYNTVRHCIEATWINDRDQFLFPNNDWEKDEEFQNDCLAYSLFRNNIQSKHGVNNWIPFTEKEISAGDTFESNFMTNFISGKIKTEQTEDLFTEKKAGRKTALVFSKEAKALFDAGLKLWRYYHQQKKCNINASLHDIRAHFQGRNDAGKMNSKSDDETYTELITDLRDKLKILAQKIEPKIYEYGFLKG